MEIGWLFIFELFTKSSEYLIDGRGHIDHEDIEELSYYINLYHN